MKSNTANQDLVVDVQQHLEYFLAGRMIQQCSYKSVPSISLKGYLSFIKNIGRQ